MAVRTILYTVDDYSLNPSSAQFGGMQNEHNATEVKYLIEERFLAKLQKDGLQLVFRIDFDSPGAGYQPSENLTLVDGSVSREISRYMTQYGGQMQTTLVISALKEGDEAFEVLSLPSVIRFSAVQKSDSDLSASLPAYQEHIEALVQQSMDSNSKSEEILEGIKKDLSDGIFDGFSPIATVEQKENGVQITITDRKQTSQATVYNGEKGDKGDKGEKGDKGDKGEQGDVSLTYVHQNFANAFKSIVSGETVTLEDVSPLPHDIKVTLTGDVDLGVSLASGEFLGTIEETPDLSVYEKQWVSIDNNGLFEVQDRVVPVDNLSGIYVNIPTFYGASAGLLITNSTQFYTLYACDASGGQIYCYIDGDICYVSYDGEQVQSFKVANGCKIVGVCCNGEQFSNNSLDVYTCTLLSGAKIIRSGKNLLDLTTTKPSHNNDTEYVKNGNSFTMKGNVGGSDYSYDAGQLLLPTNTKISEIGTPVKKDKTYTVSFDYLLIEKGQRGNSIGLYIYIPNGQFNSVIVTFAGVVGATKRLSYTFTATKDTKIGLGFRVNNNYVTISNIQIEEGNKATDFEDYVEPTEYIPNQDGSLSVPSLCPTTVLTTDTEGVTINAEYNKDTNKVINNLINAVISLGGNV